MLNEGGGIIDDLVLTKSPKDASFRLVINASRTKIVLDALQSTILSVKVSSNPDLALLALQGKVPFCFICSYLYSYYQVQHVLRY